MSELHDINSFFFRKKKKPTDDEKPKKRTTGVDESPPTKKEPAPAEVRFVSAKFEPHSVYGYTPNKEAVISGSIEFIRKTKLTKLTLELFALYNNKEENLQIKVNKYGTTEIDTNKKFKFSGVPLYYHNDYPTANSKELFNDAVTYKAVISHKHHEKPLEVTIKFPDSNAKPVDLKKGMYDTKAHNAKPGKYPADPAQGYIEGTKVFDLQQMLEALNYLPKGSADGAFGDKTDEAVKAFQGDSTRKLRLQRGVDKLIELQSITFTADIYGIVNQKTRDELMIWKRDNYQRPIPELYEHDFDTEATDRQIKSKNESGFFDKGKPVLSVQNYLQKIGVYQGCTIDGWFGPKMKDAVGVFQNAAAKGKFVVSGVETELEEKLTGFKRGVLDVWTQVHLKRVVEKGGKVAKSESHKIIFPLPFRPIESYKENPRSFGSNRAKGTRKHAGCDLYAPVGTQVFAVADGKVTRGPSEFAGGTYALEIDHDTFIVRYTEIKKECPSHIKVGAEVKQGDVIGYVAEFIGADGIPRHMLHFELYSGKSTGSLTDENHLPYKRRADLLDPTDFLDKADLSTQP